MMCKDLKIAVDIAKTKLYFFSALAGSAWLNFSLKISLSDVTMMMVFVISALGVAKNLLLLGKYEKGLQNDK